MKWKIPLFLVIIALVVFVMSAMARARGVAKTAMQKFVEYYIRLKNPNLSSDVVEKIASSAIKWCNERGVNLFSVLAIMQRESWFNPKAEGDHVSRGLMQLTKTALNELVRVGYITGYDWDRLFDIDYNIQHGTLYYLYCVRLAKGDRREAIARYRMTSQPYSPTAQQYADSVLKIREEIVEEWNKMKAREG